MTWILLILAALVLIFFIFYFVWKAGERFERLQELEGTIEARMKIVQKAEKNSQKLDVEAALDRSATREFVHTYLQDHKDTETK